MKLSALLHAFDDDTPIFEAASHISTGNEHRVYRTSDDVGVFKIPGALGPVWQNMDVETANEDLAILERYRFPFVPTTTHSSAVVVHPNPGRAEYVHYLLYQPHLSHRLIGFEDIAHDVRVRECLAEMMATRQRIFSETGLGVDVMGGAAYRDLIRTIRFRGLRALRFHADPPNPPINNLFISTQSQEGVREGEMLLADTRLFRPPEKTIGLFRKAIAALLIMPTHHVMTGALGRVMTRLGQPLENGVLNPDNTWERLGMWVADSIIDAMN